MTSTTEHTDQLEYEWAELLADYPTVEPLRAGGVRCHGGFAADGRYVSPRTKHRVPAIAAWQANHTATFGTSVLDAPLDAWPGNYPNLAQARLLITEGVPGPIVGSLTRIGTVEGFGARIRYLAPDDMQPFFREDIKGTAISHLGRGLVEAHARDEAGFEDTAGHDRMWFAVRDIAFQNPLTTDQTEALLQRLGIGVPGSSAAAFKPLFPDIDPGLEMLITTMTCVLFIEIKAFHIFAWAEALLSDADLVAGDGEAARLVSYIRADETPHVDYLRTSLTEMRDRTIVGASGHAHSGAEVIGAIWDKCLQQSMGAAEDQNRATMRCEVELALADHARGDDLLRQFDDLGGPA